MVVGDGVKIVAPSFTEGERIPSAVNADATNSRTRIHHSPITKKGVMQRQWMVGERLQAIVHVFIQNLLEVKNENQN